jgi:hypothetical protein
VMSSTFRNPVRCIRLANADQWGAADLRFSPPFVSTFTPPPSLDVGHCPLLTPGPAYAIIISILVHYGRLLEVDIKL